jgi:hypothetical protein
LTEAEALARQATQQFEKEGEIDDRAYVLAVLAEALFLQGKKEESHILPNSDVSVQKCTLYQKVFLHLESQ